ncbi:MAG: hypothetical protein QOJ13_3460 [Gaiellales bacterium]|nr:hypothetical protein [Gaiellales bacterium]
MIADGTFLMDTRDGRSERLLVREAIAGRDVVRMLIGGLGVGFSLDEALSAAEVHEVVLVEVEPTVVAWAGTHLRGLNRHGVDDPRVELVVADMFDALDSLQGRFDAICLDTDNGPGWLVHPENARLYTDAALERLAGLLQPGGRLAVWAAAPDDAFEARLREHFAAVTTRSIPVARGPGDVIYLARA